MRSAAFVYLSMFAGAVFLMTLSARETAAPSARKRAIAPRGASAYAPEHTAAEGLAVEQGADHVQQDLVSSRNTSRFPDVIAEMRYYLFDLGADLVFTDNPGKFPCAARP